MTIGAQTVVIILSSLLLALVLGRSLSPLGRW
jgi:hypothetical protein